MAEINVLSEVSTKIEMTQDEIETVKKAYDILHNIANSLWQNDADETDAYGSSSTACDCIYSFMKNEVGVNIDEKRWF